MFHIKSNFLARGPISQVPASWFNAVADFLNNFVAGYGLKLKKNHSGASVISVDHDIFSPCSNKVGEAQDKTDTDTDGDIEAEGDEWEWSAGGDNGIKFDCYCKIVGGQDEHRFERVTLTFSKDGLLVKAKKTNEQKIVWA